MRTCDVSARVAAGVKLAGGSATVPITNGMMAQGQEFAPLGVSAAESPPAASGAMIGHTEHATNLHVGGLLLFAGGFIIFWHLGGFRMAFDIGMGRG